MIWKIFSVRKSSCEYSETVHIGFMYWIYMIFEKLKVLLGLRDTGTKKYVTKKTNKPLSNNPLAVDKPLDATICSGWM